jgi:alkylated DNA repair dioxygenase AlkB
MNSQLDLFQIAKDPSKAKIFEPISGLRYIPNFISREEEATLIRFVDSEKWMTDLKRRVQHYGFKYNYKVRRIDYSMRLGNLPDWIPPLSIRLYEAGYFKEIPDQVIVNEYEIGQGISPHIDCEPCFEDTVVSLSLNSTAVMEFTNDLTGEKIPVFLESRSIVVLQGESRYDWKHSIPARQKDVVNGIVFPRKRRVSLTFRKVIL